MDMTELKKSGNKVYALAAKIEECEKNGMKTRIPGYIEKLKESRVKIIDMIDKLDKKYPS